MAIQLHTSLPLNKCQIFYKAVIILIIRKGRLDTIADVQTIDFYNLSVSTKGISIKFPAYYFLIHNDVMLLGFLIKTHQPVHDLSEINLSNLNFLLENFKYLNNVLIKCMKCMKFSINCSVDK